MTRKFLKDLADGDAVEETYLLADKQLRANRNADLYLLATLRDRSGTMMGLMWNITEESVADVGAGDFVSVRGKVQLYQGGLQMIVAGIRPVPADGLNPVDFHPGLSEDVERLMGELTDSLRAISNPHVLALAESFLVDDALMKQFMQAPAGIKAHHAYPGGLLEHVVTMMHVAEQISGLYPAIDLDLLRMGVFLHDFGKVRELTADVALSYTDEGQLLGHMVIGTELLTEKIQQTRMMTNEEFPEELAWRIKHMILSHHGQYEFGSPRLPMTPEAIALHYIDNLDAKLHEFVRSIEDDPNGQSNWTPFNPRLDRKLFKGTNRS